MESQALSDQGSYQLGAQGKKPRFVQAKAGADDYNLPQGSSLCYQGLSH